MAGNRARDRHLPRRLRALAAGIVLAGCSTTPAPTPPAIAPAPTPTVAPTGSTATAAAPSATLPPLITQPEPPAGIDLAPDSARVDLAAPTFSNPTNITNPLFPVSSQASVLMLGHVDDQPFRTEVTLLPFTRPIDWNGHRVDTAVSQYVAYLDGQIQEVAYDYYAQADDGSVWYFGEDVQDFVDGAIVTTEGTWLAGRDGLAAMIMPGHPSVGDVYRTENAPGFVFEQVTVQSIDAVLDGPLGKVPGGLIARELHADGATEDKQFAPGYGEFSTSDGVDLEALALAVPTDALAASVPADLTAIETGSEAARAAAASGRWSAAAKSLGDIEAAWDRFRVTGVPSSVAEVLAGQVDALAAAVGARRSAAAQQAALDIRESAFDLELRHRPVTEVDRARFEIWLRRLELAVDARSDARSGAAVFALDYIRDRIIRSVDAPTALAINTDLGDLQVAIVDRDYGALADSASHLREALAAAP